MALEFADRETAIDRAEEMAEVACNAGVPYTYYVYYHSGRNLYFVTGFERRNLPLIATMESDGRYVYHQRKERA
jgi:hypothetical protein